MRALTHRYEPIRNRDIAVATAPIGSIFRLRAKQGVEERGQREFPGSPWNWGRRLITLPPILRVSERHSGGQGRRTTISISTLISGV